MQEWLYLLLLILLIWPTCAAGRGAAQPRKVTANGIIYSSQVRSVDQLLYDDDAAAAEAAAAGNRPAYCGDRYFKSLAGGEKVCAKFEK